jgi:glycosyltransferase involved in cell wall biosynthesis
MRLIRTRHIQLVDAPDWSAEGLFYSLRKETPLVITAVGSTDDPISTSSTVRQLTTQRILAYFAALTVRRADKIISISRDSYLAVVRRFGVSASKVVMIPIGIDTQKFRYTSSDIRRRLGISVNDQMVLHVARLEARNGSAYLCDAIPHVIRRFPNAKFVLVGKSTKTAPGGVDFVEYVLDKAASGGFRDRLLWINFLPEDELVRLYSACDVCVYPALTSTYGLSVVEAMACSKPVVATSVGVTAELADEDTPGLTAVSIKDSGDLAEAIVGYLELSQEQREKIGVANRRLIESKLSISGWVDQVLGVYEVLSNGNKRKT